MTMIDRLSGLAPSVAYKAPVRAATTGNIALAGTQTIDGVALLIGDRVLVKDQTQPTDNGIWNVANGAWARAQDFNGARDVVKGTQVYVSEGAANSLRVFAVSTADPVSIGTSAITFAAPEAVSLGAALVTPTGGSALALNLLTTPRYRGANSGDEAAALEAAIDAATAAGRDIEISGTVRLTTGVAPASGARVHFRDGAKIVNAGLTSGVLFDVAGALGSAVSITTAVEPGDSTITATGHGFAVGDYLRVTSTLDAQEEHSGYEALRLGDRTADDLPFAETVRVLEVVDANTLRVDREMLFPYPIGSTLKKVTPWRGLIDGLTIDAGGLGALAAVNPFRAVLARLDGDGVIDLSGQMGPALIRGDIGNRWKITGRGDVDRALADNLQLVRVVDGCTGSRFICDLAHGGQLFDVTYTPTNPDRAPNLFCEVSGHAADASLSAVVSHPGSLGTNVHDLTGIGVEGLVYLRDPESRASRLNGVARKRGGQSIGLWAGENGYWPGLSASEIVLRGFETGVVLAGAGSTRGSRAAHLDDIRVEDADTAYSFGNVGEGLEATSGGIIASRLSCERITDVGIAINGTHDGIQISKSVLRGPFAVAPITVVSVELRHAHIETQVVDAGAVPIIAPVTGGSLGSDTYLRLDRVGTVLAPTIATSRVDSPRRTLSRIGTPWTAASNTSEQTVAAAALTLPAGAVYAGTVIEAEIAGLKTGSAGVATLRLSAGANLMALAQLPAATVGFRVRVRIVASAANAQAAHVTVEGADAVAITRTARTVDLSGGSTWALTAQLANAADALLIDHIQAAGEWV